MVLHFSNVEIVEVTSKVGYPEMVLVIVPIFPLSDTQTLSLAITVFSDFSSYFSINIVVFFIIIFFIK